MAPSRKELYQRIVNLSYSEKVSFGSEAARIVFAYLSDHFNEDDATFLYALLIGNYVGVDGTISPAEYAFCSSMLGLGCSAAAFCDAMKNSCSPANVERLDQLIDASPEDVKAAFVSLGLAICSIDDKLTPEEQVLLAKYIS